MTGGETARFFIYGKDSMAYPKRPVIFNKTFMDNLD